MNIKTFWVEQVVPKVYDWKGNIGRPRYRRLDTGEELRGSLPAGALYVAGREDDYPNMCGSDGLSIVCILPTGDHWFIDGRASNCTMREDTAHRCWVRHGTLGGTVHVDKTGNTCAAGAGSIAVDGFHGFLHDGELRSC